MGRKPRLEFKGAIYHVIKRGNNRDFIFQGRDDKESLLKYLQSVKEDFPFNLLGYVIMNNHYHLIIETEDKPLHKIMQRLNNLYSKDYNKRHNRSDHVFGARYKGILVMDDKYLFSLLRYIHNNPVRASICQNIAQYNWSSDRYYRNNFRELVHIDKILDMFSDNRKIALEEYQRFMDQKEPLIKAKDFYEEGDIIGEVELENQPPESLDEEISLDQILRQVVANEEDFQRIKKGSRKRSLKEYKINYVKKALDYGYSFKDIGENIGVTAEAVNRIV
ncbi:MAG: transposase [Bacillota bacterium]